MSLEAGRRLAHYKILEKIGSGGMGEVYLAEDGKLGRRVALKVLPPDLAANEEHLARFQREAKAIAALNHPNIVTVHSVEEDDGVHFITMELVKGKTLAALLPRKGFALERFFEIAIPLADAVAAAHEAGIVHRDLKPANVMVTDDGQVKVLDFGLARTEAPIQVEGDSESPTVLKTQEGVLAGTLHYMSPEQAEGKTVDHRTDIFSLGVVYHEMLTGKRPFDGDSPAAVLSAILKDSAEPIAAARPELPPPLVATVEQCLSKNLSRRYQSARDLQLNFDVLRRSSAPAAAAPPIPSSPRMWQLATFALAAGSIAMLLYRSGSRTNAFPRVAHPRQITYDVGVEDYPAWSPDGTMLAYNGNAKGNGQGGEWKIWVKPLGSEGAIDRSSGSTSDDRYPSWSPDGTQLVFWSSREGGGHYVMPALTGMPRRVTSWDISPIQSADMGTVARWSPTGDELAYVDFGGQGAYIRAVSLTTGKERSWPLKLAKGLSALELSWSPDGKEIAFVEAVSDLADTSRLWLVRTRDGASVPLTAGSSRAASPCWAPDGQSLLYISNRGGTNDLWWQGLTNDGEPEGGDDRIRDAQSRALSGRNEARLFERTPCG